MKNVSNISKLIGVVSLGALIGVFALGFRNPDEFIAMGAWGDLVGGALNPIFSLLALLAVLTTIHLQLQELKETREELKRSSKALESQIETNEAIKFENTFFELIKLYNSVTETIQKLETTAVQRLETKTYTGKNAIYLIYIKMYNGTEKPTYKIEETNRLFQDIYRTNGSLAQYFRITHNILRILSDSSFTTETHIRIFRAQFSNHEMCMLFYNGLTPLGDNMRPYLEKFEFFDNLPLSELKNASHARELSPATFGFNDTTELEAEISRCTNAS